MREWVEISETGDKDYPRRLRVGKLFWVRWPGYDGVWTYALRSRVRGGFGCVLSLMERNEVDAEDSTINDISDGWVRSAQAWVMTEDEACRALALVALDPKTAYVLLTGELEA